MNQERFDELTKALAVGKISRGSALKMLGAALVGAVLASGRGAALADDQCKPLLKKCNKNAQCCSGNCIESPQGSGKVCGCAAGQTLCPANNSCVQDCLPGQTLDPTTCRCTQCQNASDCPTPDNVCQRATCTNGLCGVENVPDGTSCDDQNECTTNDVCTAGVCAGTLSESCVGCQADPDCAEVPVDQCHRALCGAQGYCVVEDLPDGTNCDDGDPCTEGDVCTAGVCAGTQVEDCVRCQSDGDCSGIGVDNPCREAVCTQAGVCVIQDKADGTPCNDGQACTENDVCIAGMCGGCLTVDNSNPEAPATPCEDPCTRQVLSEQAAQDPEYSTLANHLVSEGFVVNGEPVAIVLTEDGAAPKSFLITPYRNPNTGEIVRLFYEIEASNADVVAIVYDADGTAKDILIVDPEGNVTSALATPPATSGQLTTFQSRQLITFQSQSGCVNQDCLRDAVRNYRDGINQCGLTLLGVLCCAGALVPPYVIGGVCCIAAIATWTVCKQIVENRYEEDKRNCTSTCDSAKCQVCSGAGTCVSACFTESCGCTPGLGCYEPVACCDGICKRGVWQTCATSGSPC